MPKSPDALAGTAEDTVVIHAEKGAANLSPEDVQRQKALRNEMLKARGAEIVGDAGKFVKEKSQAGKAALKSGMMNALSGIGTALSKGWSGLGKAAGFAWDGALLGLGMGAHAKDKTVEAAGKAKDATVEAAGKAKDKTIEVAGQVKAGVVDTAVATRDLAVETKNAVKSQLLDDVSNRSEVLQAYRATGDYLSEKSDQAKEYVAGKVTAAGEAYDAAKAYTGEKYDAVKESLVRNGRAIIESKAAKYTAKGLKYAGIGTAATIGLPLAAGAYAVAGPLLAWKDPAQLNEIRAQIKEKFPVAGMNVGEALEAVGSKISEKARELGTKVWGKMTGAMDRLSAWKNGKKAQMMESMGVTSSAEHQQLKAKLDQALEDQRTMMDTLAALQTQVSDQNKGIDWSKGMSPREAGARIAMSPDAAKGPSDLDDVNAELGKVFGSTTQVGNPTAQA